MRASPPRIQSVHRSDFCFVLDLPTVPRRREFTLTLSSLFIPPLGVMKREEKKSVMEKKEQTALLFG